MDLAARTYIHGFGAVEIKELALSNAHSILDLPSGYIVHQDVGTAPLMGIHFHVDPTQSIPVDDQMLTAVRKGIGKVYSELFDTRMLYFDVRCNNRKSIENARAGIRFEMKVKQDGDTNIPMFLVHLPNNVVGVMVPAEYKDHHYFIKDMHHKHFHVAFNKQCDWVVSIEHPEFPVSKHMSEILMITGMQQIIEKHLQHFGNMLQINVIQPTELYLV